MIASTKKWHNSAVVFPLVVVALLWMPQGGNAQGGHRLTREATCRDSRLLPKSSWPLDENGKRHLRLEVDVNDDGLADVLEATYSSGSGSGSTSVELTLGGGGDKLRAEETFDFSVITAVNPVPKELFDPRHHAGLAWIEEALFPRICESPDPSLAWLLDKTKRLTWIEGPPEMPGFYAIRLPARRLVGSVLAKLKDAEGPVDPDEEVWISYAGHVHAYPDREGRAKPVLLAQEGDRVLLGTAHGVILTNSSRSKHAWIFVSEGGDKLRNPSIAGARLRGDTAIVTLLKPLFDSDSPSTEAEKTKQPQVRVNLKTGGVSRQQESP